MCTSPVSARSSTPHGCCDSLSFWCFHIFQDCHIFKKFTIFVIFICSRCSRCFIFLLIFNVFKIFIFSYYSVFPVIHISHTFRVFQICSVIPNFLIFPAYSRVYVLSCFPELLPSSQLPYHRFGKLRAFTLF